MKKGLFITFEGCEGSGKSTQSVLIYEHLKKNGFNAIHTREPGGTKLAELIRNVLLNPENRISPVTELLLYEAARAQHIHELVSPSLESGKIVICDRYTDATLAYQGYGRGLNISTIKTLNDIASQSIRPDLTIFLDIPVEEGLTKARELAKDTFGPGDRLERESLSFHQKVREGYLAIAKTEPERIKIVKLEETIALTHQNIIVIIDSAIKEAFSGTNLK